MTVSLYVAHVVADTELAGNWVDLIEGALPDLSLTCTSLPGYAPAPDDGLPEADVVVGLLTPAAILGGSVLFQLGAARAVGLSSLLLLQEGVNGSVLELPLEETDVVAVRSREDALGVVAELAERLGRELVYGQELEAALMAMYPAAELGGRYSDVSGVRETGPLEAAASAAGATEQQRGTGAVPSHQASSFMEAPEPGPARGLPTCAASLSAGRAFADCSFNRDRECLADELDMPFGTFLTALGGQWGQLRDLNDPDLWSEVVQNLLDSLAANEGHVRAFYCAGTALAIALNVAEFEVGPDRESQTERADAFVLASGDLLAALEAIGFDEGDRARVRAMLDNLIGPDAEKDYTLVARLQQIVGEYADSRDADLAA